MQFERIIKKNFFALCSALLLSLPGIADGQTVSVNSPSMEVTGSATINIVPNKISLEIGIEEYYKPKIFGDSALVKLADIEKKVRKVLNDVGIPDSNIVVSEIGNYRRREVSENILLAKRLTATLTDFSQIDEIADKLDRKGITSLNVTKLDNTEMERYNREGLKAALDAAREKAQFIAENEGVSLWSLWEIVETGPNYFDGPSVSNVVFDKGAGMENFRQITRRYSVKVVYLLNR